MPKPLHIRRGEYGGTVVRNAVIITVVLVIVGLVWFTGNRIKELNRELAASEQRAEKMNERLREYSEQLEETIGNARQARDRAESAENQVAATSEALEQTSEQLEATQEQVQSVTAEREQARAEKAQTLQEIEAIQRRRAAELDRMQQALNKVAPTKRTPAGMVMVLSDSNFRFAFDKATIPPQNRELLSRIAGILLASEGYRLFVDGHTDDQGDANYNTGLSLRRATSVRDYLVGAGVPASVIEVHGYGKNQPLVKATTKDARAANRRVEIGIVDTIVHYEKQVKN